jgi:hypothetical protein
MQHISEHLFLLIQFTALVSSPGKLDVTCFQVFFEVTKNKELLILTVLWCKAIEMKYGGGSNKIENNTFAGKT